MKVVRFLNRHARRPDAGFRRYIASRERLGIPSYAAELAVSCPWCQADPGRPCRARAVGTALPHPHEARATAANLQQRDHEEPRT